MRRGKADMGAFITDVVRVLFRTGRDGGARDLERGIIACSAPTSTLCDKTDGPATPDVRLSWATEMTATLGLATDMPVADTATNCWIRVPMLTPVGNNASTGWPVSCCGVNGTEVTPTPVHLTVPV